MNARAWPCAGPAQEGMGTCAGFWEGARAELGRERNIFALSPFFTYVNPVIYTHLDAASARSPARGASKRPESGAATASNSALRMTQPHRSARPSRWASAPGCAGEGNPDLCTGRGNLNNRRQSRQYRDDVDSGPSAPSKCLFLDFRNFRGNEVLFSRVGCNFPLFSLIIYFFLRAPLL